MRYSSTRLPKGGATPHPFPKFRPPFIIIYKIVQIMPEVYMLDCIYALPAYRGWMGAKSINTGFNNYQRYYMLSNPSKY